MSISVSLCRQWDGLRWYGFSRGRHFWDVLFLIDYSSLWRCRKPTYICARSLCSAQLLQLQKRSTNQSWSKAAVRAPKMSFRFPKVVWFGHAAPPSDRCDQGGSLHLSLDVTRKMGLRIFMSASSENSRDSPSLSRPPWPSGDPCQSLQWANCHAIL